MRWERRRRYPKNWEQLARACKEAAGQQCMYCAVAQGTELISKRTGAVYKVALHAAHQDHDVGNQRPRLLCLCPSCHGTYDAKHRQRRRQTRLEQKKHRRLLNKRRELVASY